MSQYLICNSDYHGSLQNSSLFVKIFSSLFKQTFSEAQHNCIKLLLKLFKKSYKQVTNTNKKLMPLTIITLAETSFVLRSWTEPECSLFLAAIPNGSSALCILQTSASRQWLLYEKIDRYKILGLENNRFICFSNNQGVKLLSTHLLFTMMVSWYSLSYIQIFRSTVCLSTHTGTSMALAMAWMEIWVNKDKIVDKTTEKNIILKKTQNIKYQNNNAFSTLTLSERGSEKVIKNSVSTRPGIWGCHIISSLVEENGPNSPVATSPTFMPSSVP